LVDFYLAEMYSYFDALYPSERKNFSFWGRIKHNFEQLPQTKAYYQRPDAVHGPYLPPGSSVAPKNNHVKLAYWGIRGLAQTPRHLLAFSGVKFENFLYTNGDDWFKNDKLHAGIDFPNLPYLIDGEYNIT
jgi:hypothetical protein